MTLLDQVLHETYALNEFVRQDDFLTQTITKCSFRFCRSDSEAGIPHYFAVSVKPGAEDMVQEKFTRFSSSFRVVALAEKPEAKKSPVPLKYPYVIS